MPQQATLLDKHWISWRIDMTILEKALELTTGDRQRAYGHPADDFGKVAQMTRPIIQAVYEGKIDPRLGHSLYMVQVKIARLLNTPDHYDSIVDGAGYFNTYGMVVERMVVEQETFCPLEELE